jgi:protein arginine kinase
MQLPELALRAAPWQRTVPAAGIAVSSRVRLARNLRGHAFPGRADETERTGLWDVLSAWIGGLESLESPFRATLAALKPLDRRLLFERHLISREHSAPRPGGGIVLKRDESVCVMVNEEDHLRIQAFQPGLNLERAWRVVDRLDSAIEGEFDYAFSPELGYLTACPSNVGTGLRASVMLHLPALSLLGEIEAVLRGIGKLGLAARGLWGEGSEAAGNLYQISNQRTLGERETDLLNGLEDLVLELVEHEENARQRLLERRKTLLEDHVGRAGGILENARLLSSREALDWLSGLRLGVELGMVSGLDAQILDDLRIAIQPAHLQTAAGRALDEEERDQHRARTVRSRIERGGARRGTERGGAADV